jgi:hypothetical protein
MCLGECVIGEEDLVPELHTLLTAADRREVVEQDAQKAVAVWVSGPILVMKKPSN